jgi:hypothetical protein
MIHPVYFADRATERVGCPSSKALESEGIHRRANDERRLADGGVGGVLDGYRLGPARRLVGAPTTLAPHERADAEEGEKDRQQPRDQSDGE